MFYFSCFFFLFLLFDWNCGVYQLRLLLFGIAVGRVPIIASVLG